MITFRSFLDVLQDEEKRVLVAFLEEEAIAGSGKASTEAEKQIESILPKHDLTEPAESPSLLSSVSELRLKSCTHAQYVTVLCVYMLPCEWNLYGILRVLFMLRNKQRYLEAMSLKKVWLQACGSMGSQNIQALMEISNMETLKENLLRILYKLKASRADNREKHSKLETLGRELDNCRWGARCAQLSRHLLVQHVDVASCWPGT